MSYISERIPAKAVLVLKDMDFATTVPAPAIESRILLIRGQKVMLDSDLAELYGVPTKALNQAVKRNLDRFPEDFMFRLGLDEARHLHCLRSQSVTLNETDGTHGRGKFRKYSPYVFTEHGVAMLSSVLSSERAIAVNIAIIRTFIRLRQFLSTHQDVAGRLDHLEWRQNEQAVEIHRVFETIEQLIEGPPPDVPKRRIGFPAAHADPHLTIPLQNLLG